MSEQRWAADEAEFARAVVAGDVAAVQRFERVHLGALDAALAHMKLDRDTLDEVKQRVRERLLLAEPPQPARLESYAGQGKLEGLVVVTGSRIALDLLRARKAPASEASAIERLADEGADPLLAAMKSAARSGFREAFSRAIESLSPRDRALLKMHLLRGVTLESLATMYGVHRATVVRWLADARAKVVAETRRALSDSVRSGELDETMALIESQLDASIERLFRTQS